MGRKYNPEYRANLKVRLAKPKCVCGRRVTSGMHKKCKQLLDQDMTYEDALRAAAPLWLIESLSEDKYRHLEINRRLAQVSKDRHAGKPTPIEPEPIIVAEKPHVETVNYPDAYKMSLFEWASL